MSKLGAPSLDSQADCLLGSDGSPTPCLEPLGGLPNPRPRAYLFLSFFLLLSPAKAEDSRASVVLNTSLKKQLDVLSAAKLSSHLWDSAVIRAEREVILQSLLVWIEELCFVPTEEVITKLLVTLGSSALLTCLSTTKPSIGSWSMAAMAAATIFSMGGTTPELVSGFALRKEQPASGRSRRMFRQTGVAQMGQR